MGSRSTLMPVVGTDGIERQLPFLWKEEDMQGACFDSAGAGEAGEQARWAGSRHSGGSSGGHAVRTRRSGILTLIFAARLIQQCTRRLQGIGRGTDGAKGRAMGRAKGRGSSEACAPGIGSGARSSTSATKRREHVGFVGGCEHSTGMNVDDDDATLLSVGNGTPVGRSGAVVSTCMREDDATLLGGEAEIDAARARVAELQRRRAAGELTAEEAAQLQALERHLALFDADNDPVAVAAELQSVRARMAELERRRAAGELTPEELAELTALEGRVAALEAALEAPADASSGGRAGRLQHWALRGGDEFGKPEHTNIQPALNDPATRIAALQRRLESEGLTPAELAELQALLQAQHPRLADSHEGVGGGAGGPRHGRRGGLRSGVDSSAPDTDEVADERRRHEQHEKHENGRPRAESRAAGKATPRDAELMPVEQLETSVTEYSGAEITSSGHAGGAVLGTRGKLQPWALRQPEVGKLIAEEPLWKRRELAGRSARSGSSGAVDTWPPRRKLTRVVRRTPKPRSPPVAPSRLTSSHSAASLPPLSASHSGDALLGKTSTLKHAAQNKPSEILASVGLRSSKMVPGLHACADGDFILRPLSREQASLALQRAFRGEPCPFNLSAFRQVPSTDGLPSGLRESKQGHLPSELSPASLKSMVESLQQNSLSSWVPLADPHSTSPSTSPSLLIVRDWRAMEARSVLWYGQSLTATELVPARAALAPLPKASCSSLPPLLGMLSSVPNEGKTSCSSLPPLSGMLSSVPHEGKTSSSSLPPLTAGMLPSGGRPSLLGMLPSVAPCGLKSVESAPGKLRSTRPSEACNGGGNQPAIGKLRSMRPQQTPAADMQKTQRRLVTGTREHASRRLNTPITSMWWGISEDRY